jgi:hypothetical protein
MDFTRIIYEVIETDPASGLICIQDEKGEKSEVRIPIEDNKKLLTEIKNRDKVELEVKGWQVRSIRRINTESSPNS